MKPPTNDNSQSPDLAPTHHAGMIRTTKKAGRTRSQLLATALRLFQTKGFEGATIREIAKAMDMSVGSAYYYFKSKDEIILAFYEETLHELQAIAPGINASTTDLGERMTKLINGKLEQLIPYKSFLNVLARSASDSSSPLSPFSNETTETREESIQIFRDALVGVRQKLPRSLEPYLAYLFWLYYMGIVFFWINDRSPQQKRTAILLKRTMAIIMQLTRVVTLPLMSGVLRPVVGLLEELGIAKDPLRQV